MFASHWVEMTPFLEGCTGYSSICPQLFTAFSTFVRANDSCGRSCGFIEDFSNKRVVCPAGEVMVGTRFYEWTSAVDEEHEDASCASTTELSFSSPHWVEAPNAYDVLYGGYKEAVCPAGEVMIGTNMFGIYYSTDEEHIDAYCAKLIGAVLSPLPHWVEAPNAYAVLYGGYKEAVCPAGEVMIGTRFYEWTNDLDEEHTDALCALTTVQPSVRIWFN